MAPIAAKSRKDDSMKSTLKRALALILMAVLLLSNVNLFPAASAAPLFYGDYTDARKVYDSNSCPSMQGLAVGSQYLYTIKIKTDNSRAVITRTDKDTGSYTTLTDASTGYSYLTGLDHANDMAVWGIDSKSHLFIGTTLQGSNAIIRYRVNGTTLEKVASYHLTCDGEDICATALDVMKVDSSGYIHLITKWGQTIYTGTVHKDAGSNPTVAMTELCTISKEMAYIKGEKLDLSDWVNQGFGYYDNTLFVPLSGPDDQLNRSVVLVYDLANVQQGSTIYPTDSVVFRVTSGAYSALFEIESVDVCSADKKLYFNTNRRVTDSDTNHDGVSSFDGYTYTKPAAASFDNVKHFHAKFLPNGGTGTMDIQRIVTGISTPLSANAYTRTGYTFAGWSAHRLAQNQWYYTNGSTTGWYAQGSQPSGYTYYIYRDQQKVAATSNVYDDTVEYVAQWKPIDYTVTWTIDGQVYKTTTAHYGDKLTPPAYTAPAGSVFSGWTVPATMPAENLTINATLSGLSSTVTWVVDGKTTTETYDYGDTPSYKGSTDKASDGCTKYTFTGWDPTIAAVTGDVTYTAIYTSTTEHSYESVTTDATCTTPGYTTYTCSGCGDSYTEYEGTLTEWSETKPTNIPEDEIETKQQYRYADKITTTSSSATLDGYTLESSAWDTTGTAGSVQYVKSWPSGFSTSHSLYSAYNKTPKTAGETSTTKTTVSSDTTTGYLYYHWCYADSYYSVAAKQGSYTTFHAYYSTTNPSNYVCDYTDMSYETAHSTCSNSDWWFVAEVNTQKYTTYDKIYTHYKWSDWSAWSDTQVSATATRQVESRTMYRYLDTPLGSHSYNAVVTKPTCTADGYTTYTCSGCGDSYVSDKVAATDHTYVEGVCTACGAIDSDFAWEYYLIGYINGADYGCEDDYANMGQYKFVDGKLTAKFDSDSYVFVKTTSNAKWYMTSGWLGTETTTATLYNTASGLADANKLFVPGGVEMNFTLTVNENDTLTLSYEPAHKHDYKAVVTAPTCTEDGYTTYTCSGCGDSYVADKVTASGHSFSEGTCGVCGAADPDYVAPVEKFDIDFAQVELGNALNIRFAFPASGAEDWTDCYAVATKTYADGRDDLTITVPVTEWQSANINGAAHYYFSFSNISGKEMADDIYVTIYNADGAAISNEYTESIRSYVMRILDNQNAKTRTMLVDMLNYGSAAQSFYDYGTDNLANSELTAAQKSYGTETVKTCTDSRKQGDNYLGTRLELKSSIVMQFAFKGLTEDMTAKVEFTNHRGVKVTETVTPVMTEDAGLVIAVDQIVAADGRQTVTVTVYDANGKEYGSATDSLESYLARMGTGNALYASIMKFSDAAYTYLHE